jgi:subtilisin-like proprotein convertase family protein
MATIPFDPLFVNQWHLQNRTPTLLDLNVVDVWDDYTGAGVEVAVIDDAVQWTHPDLSGNYSTAKDWDFANNDTDAIGTNDDSHGTAVAGVIGASSNNIGGVGVAYGAKIFGFQQVFIQQVSQAIDNASGLQRQSGVNREADVVNMSIGTQAYEDNNGIDRAIYFDFLINPLVMTDLNNAIDNAVKFGRNELGTILVKSAGNSRGLNQNTNASSWDANARQILVAAVDQDGFISSYSTPGASVLVSGFGTSGQVVTTDRTGASGDKPGDYRADFDGTSAAAPMVSGVVALMLEANPNLGWRDVQSILAYSARHVGSEVGMSIQGDEKNAWSFNGATNWNGGGLHFSNDYGFGLVDAKAAVRLAETWGNQPQTSGNQVSITQDFLDGTRTIGTEGTSFSKSIGNSVDLELVEVDISFSQWAYSGDLSMRLVSPDGTQSVLIARNGDDTSPFGGSGVGRWTFSSNAFRGEDTAGMWQVELFDADENQFPPIVINDIKITFNGQSSSRNDTFIFTEEYSDYAVGGFGHSRLINGGIGVDTINAAAVDSASSINLNTGFARIDGVGSMIYGIENAFTGDGDDRIIGSNRSNKLSGMCGRDLLNGNGGDDTLDGGAGDDSLLGGTGDDLLLGGSGNDYLYGYGGTIGEIDTLVGGAGLDRFVLANSGGVSYQGLGYAIIQGWNWLEDKIQLSGSILQYSFTVTAFNGVGSNANDIGLYFNQDLIGIIQDSTNFSLENTLFS